MKLANIDEHLQELSKSREQALSLLGAQNHESEMAGFVRCQNILTIVLSYYNIIRHPEYLSYAEETLNQLTLLVEKTSLGVFGANEEIKSLNDELFIKSR